MMMMMMMMMVLCLYKGKGKGVYILPLNCSIPHIQGSQAWITQFHLQITPCLPLPRKRSPDGASPDWGCGHLIAAYYSFIYRKDERLSKPGWLTYSGRSKWHKWSPVSSCRSSAWQGKFAGQRPTFYHCATQPTNQQPCLSDSSVIRERTIDQSHVSNLWLWYWPISAKLTDIHNYSLYKKLTSRWDRRTLPPEPRHRCKTLLPLC